MPKFNVGPKPIKNDEMKFKPPSRRSSISSIDMRIVAGVIIIAVIALIIISYGMGWINLGESPNIEDIEMCPDLTCPVIPACPTIPACPECPDFSCPDCSLSTSEFSLPTLNQTCMSFNQILNLRIYNTTGDYITRRMSYTGNYYEYVIEEDIENVTSVRVIIGG